MAKRKKSTRVGRVHMVIPDCQVQPGVDTSHLTWIGNYILAKRPDVVVNIGDFSDMLSLNSYAIGKAEAEGTRYADDIACTKEAMGKLLGPMWAYNRRHKKKYQPEMHLTLGNHEFRIEREAESNPKLIGTISVDDLGYKEAGWKVHDFLKVVKIDGIEYCLEETTKVLTADLRYVEIRTLSPGDQLIGFDEHNPGLTSSGKKLARRYKTSTVVDTCTSEAELFEVAFSDGTTLKTTADHRMLARTATGMGWVHTRDLVTGTLIPRLHTPWKLDVSRDAGWLAGLVDGEGWISRPNSKQGGIQVGFAQNHGIVLDRARSILSLMGIETDEHTQDGGAGHCQAIRVGGVSGDKLSFLGRVRPERLIAKFNPEMLGRMQAKKWIGVVSVTPVGMGRIVQIKTSTGTLIAEGLPQHNCHYFISGSMGRPVSSASALLRARHCSAIMGHVQRIDMAIHPNTQAITLFAGICYLHEEKYLTPQGNNTKRGIWLLNEVANGTFDPMFVSLEFLRRNYS